MPIFLPIVYAQEFVRPGFLEGLTVFFAGIGFWALVQVGMSFWENWKDWQIQKTQYKLGKRYFVKKRKKDGKKKAR